MTYANLRTRLLRREKRLLLIADRIIKREFWYFLFDIDMTSTGDYYRALLAARSRLSDEVVAITN